MPCVSTPADFCLVCIKIMHENPHTFLMKTGSYTEKKLLPCKMQAAADNYWIDAVFGDDVIYQLLDVGK